MTKTPLTTKRQHPFLLLFAGIKLPWSYDCTLPALYAALHPSHHLELIVSELYAHAVCVTGPLWAGIHLRIEKDWWYDSGFCNLNR